MHTLRESVLSGCFELGAPRHEDARCSFSKPFHSQTFESLGLEDRFVECYWSVSHRGVVSGMHFVAPPADHAKLV